MGANGSGNGLGNGHATADGAGTASSAAVGAPRAARGGVRARLDRLAARFTFRFRLTLLGVGATLAVVLMDVFGLLGWVERPLYDLRAKTCQFGRPTTVPFVHVDVDDASLEAMGKWPWPRRVLAAAVDEMRSAGAKRIALDLLFPEPERREEWVRIAEGYKPRAATGPTTRGSAGDDDDDRVLARAIAGPKRSDGRAGDVYLPVTFGWAQVAEEEIAADVREVLKANPGWSFDDVRQEVLREWPNDAAEVDRVMRDSFVRTRQEVFLGLMLADPRGTRADHHKRIVVDGRGPLERAAATRPSGITVNPVERFFERQFDKSEAMRALWAKFPRDVGQADEGLGLLTTSTEDGPVRVLAEGVEGFGFVDYRNDDDGIVRSVPLVVNHRKRMVPQLGLALACAELGVNPQVKGAKAELVIEPDRIVLRPKDGPEVVVPVYTARQRGGRVRVGSAFQIPWYGGRDWESMFRSTAGGGSVRHLPFTAVSKILEMRVTLDENRRRSLEDLNALRTLSDARVRDENGVEVGTQLKPLPPVEAVDDGYEKAVGETLARRRFFFTETVEKAEREGFAGRPPETAAYYRTALRRREGLQEVLGQNRQLLADLANAKAELRDAVAGRVVIVGWTATAQAADFVPTPIHDKCPGAVLHGAIYNAIMTRSGMRMAPPWQTTGVALLLGLAAVWVMVQAAPREEPGRRAGRSTVAQGPLRRAWGAVQLKLSPTQATALGVSVVVAWVLVNAVVLFGWRHYVVGMAAPLLAVLLVWSLGIVAIAAERFRVTQLLRGYVDPKLVEYLKKNPEEELFRTRTQDLTVCFSDIAGFTSLTQQLGGRMVPLLQEYLSRMVEVIRRHNGVVNKFMGDGIMYMFGVPEQTGNHAEAALRCCLEMQEALDRLNDERAPDGLPRLEVRIGVNTGAAYVGDAGPVDAREYTALGDTTNLAARLEPANKEFGTRILVSGETRRRVTGDAFFFRPVGRLKLRNREGLVETFELVGLAAAAGSKDLEHARLMEGMVGAFQSQMFDECMGFANRICRDFGDSRLCELYRRQCEELKRDGVGAGAAFEGQVLRQ